MLERRYSEHETKGFIGLFRRNEFVIIASAAIFFGSLIAGYFLAPLIDQIMSAALKSFKDSISKGEIQLNTLSIFLNNIKIAISLYGFGLSFGFFTILMLAYNGLFIGYVASQYNVGDFIIFTVPHGIFEISGIIIAGAAGFRLASTLIHVIKDIFKMERHVPIKEQLSDILDLNYFEFMDSLKLFLIAAVLILIAAFIEANFTLAWGNYIRGII
jgi:stage II sporulation protein M